MKAVISFLLLSLVFFSSQTAVLAHCPLCVAGAGAGLSLSRVLGVDDSITGIWIAAVLGGVSLWSANLLKIKLLPAQSLVIYIGVFVLTLWSFYQFNLINTHAGKIAGVDKLTFGLLTGGVIFYLAEVLNRFSIKKLGKSILPYQGIIVSLGVILIWSIAVFILINYYI